MKQIGSYEAKTHLSQLLDEVEAGQSVVITRNGRPAARLVPVAGDAPDGDAAIAAMQEFGEVHKGKLKGISAHYLIEDGRRF
jgi:prevent-host-death family protein